jgi:hypothetical protein
MNMPTDLRHQAMIAARYLEKLEMSLRAQATWARRQADMEAALTADTWAERAHELKRYINGRVTP